MVCFFIAALRASTTAITSVTTDGQSVLGDQLVVSNRAVSWRQRELPHPVATMSTQT